MRTLILGLILLPLCTWAATPRTKPVFTLRQMREAITLPKYDRTYMPFSVTGQVTHLNEPKHGSPRSIVLTDDTGRFEFYERPMSLQVGDVAVMEVVGEAKNGEEAVELARALKPDVIMMDLMMPRLSGAAATKAICAELPKTKVIVLTSFGTSKEMADAILNGAKGALTKEIDTTELANAIRTVASGGTCISQKLRNLSRAEASALAHRRHLLPSDTSAS